MPPLQLSRVTVQRFSGVKHNHAKTIRTIDIPNELQQKFVAGIQLPSRDIAFHFQDANADVYAGQVQEMVDNPRFKWGYIAFPAGYWENMSGYYLFEKFTADANPKWPNYLDCTMTATFLGASNLRTGTYWWGQAVESYIGFTTLPTYEMVSLPNTATGVDNPAASALSPRFTADGASITILDSPTRANIHYKLGVQSADWYLGECRVFDTVTVGNATESSWRRVYSPTHVLLGDCVFDNGLLRYRVSLNGSDGGTIYAWDSVATNAWVLCGAFGTYDRLGNFYAVINLDILRFSSEEITWRETRMYGSYIMTATFTLRRGAYHLRVQLTSPVIEMNQNSVRLTKTGGFAQIFNSGASGAAGGGDLAPQASSNYECGYNTTDNIVGGFVLTAKPTQQPYDPGAGGNVFYGSNGGGTDTWPAGTLRTFFVIAWPQETNPFVLTTARANAAEIAAQCLYSLNQELILPAAGLRI